MAVNFSTWQFLRFLLIFGGIPNVSIFTKTPICTALIRNYFIRYINYRSNNFQNTLVNGWKIYFTNVYRKSFILKRLILELVNRIYKNNSKQVGDNDSRINDLSHHAFTTQLSSSVLTYIPWISIHQDAYNLVRVALLG